MPIRRLQDEPHLPEEVRRGLAKYESGQNLLAIIELPGYIDLLDLLQQDIDAAEKALKVYGDSDPSHVLRLLAELQGKQKALAFLKLKVKQYTALVTNPPDTIKNYVTF